MLENLQKVAETSFAINEFLERFISILLSNNLCFWGYLKIILQKMY